MNRIRKTDRTNTAAARRGGNAAVECALVAPLLVLLVLAAIDFGQFINVSQVVDNASREGGRRAARQESNNTTDVDAAVVNYLATYFPGTTTGDIESATTITVSDTSGVVITGGSLAAVPSGTALVVEVKFEYDKVRWMSSFAALGGKTLRTRTVMRRE